MSTAAQRSPSLIGRRARRPGPQASLARTFSVAGACGGIVIGVAIGIGRSDVALLVALAVLGLAVLDRLSLTGWCALLLVAAIVPRAPVELLGLPSAFSFVHYPLVIAFAATAFLRPSTAGSQRAGASPARWVLGLLAVMAFSLAANFSHPIRALVFFAIVGEPLIVMWAIRRWGVDASTQRRVLMVAAVLLAIQLPLALWQGLTYGIDDPDLIRGTFYNQGGSHTLGGVFAVGLFIFASGALARVISLRAAIAFSGLAVAVMFFSGSRQVVLAAAVGLAAMAISSSRVKRARPTQASTRLSVGKAVLAVVLAGVGIFGFNQLFGSEQLERAENLARPDQLPETQMITERAATDRVELLFGSGPGTSGSRASLLLTPSQLKEESPLSSLQLPPTEEALQIVAEKRAAFGGSAESFASSAFAIVGDLGLVGLAALLLLFARIWRETRRSSNWLGPAARGSLVMTATLIFVDNWIEFPEFAIPLATLFALATSDVGEDSLPEAFDRMSPARIDPVFR